MRRTRKPVGGAPLKRKEGEKASETGREGGRLNTIGEKKAEQGKRSLKKQQMTSSSTAGNTAL